MQRLNGEGLISLLAEQAVRMSQADYEKDSKVQQLQRLMRSLQLQVRG